MRRIARPLFLLLAMAVLPASAAVEVVLEDGSELSGSSLEREGDLYLLTLETGETLTFPLELVKQVRLTDGLDPEEEEEEAGSVEEDSAEPLPSRGEPQREVYSPLATPSPSEQLAAFGREPADFRKSLVENRWNPEESLGYQTDVSQFRPTRWFRPAYDPTWRPTSGYQKTSGPPDFNPSRWYRSPIRSIWRPRNGWGSTVWFPPLFSERD